MGVSGSRHRAESTQTDKLLSETSSGEPSTSLDGEEASDQDRKASCRPSVELSTFRSVLGCRSPPPPGFHYEGAFSPLVSRALAQPPATPGLGPRADLGQRPRADWARPAPRPLPLLQPWPGGCTRGPGPQALSDRAHLAFALGITASPGSPAVVTFISLFFLIYFFN